MDAVIILAERLAADSQAKAVIRNRVLTPKQVEAIHDFVWEEIEEDLAAAHA